METSPDRTGAQEPTGEGRGAPWSLALLLLAAVGVAISLLLAFREPPNVSGDAASATSKDANWSPAPAPQGETVALTIDFGNGAQREFDALPWHAGMTVGDLLRQARKFRPAIEFTQKGEGETAFLTSLEGVANESDAGRYWLYRIDDRHINVSFDVAPLAAGERVLWRFGEPE